MCSFYNFHLYNWSWSHSQYLSFLPSLPRPCSLHSQPTNPSADWDLAPVVIQTFSIWHFEFLMVLLLLRGHSFPFTYIYIVVACRIFIEACGIFRWGVRASLQLQCAGLVAPWHVGSYQGSNPCPLHWKADSQPLGHQGSPSIHFKKLALLWHNSHE